jgi:hypothetical protein
MEQGRISRCSVGRKEFCKTAFSKCLFEHIEHCGITPENIDINADTVNEIESRIKEACPYKTGNLCDKEK